MQLFLQYDFLRKIFRAVCRVIIIIFCVVSLYQIVRIFVFDQFVIPSNSMMPTLCPGDRVIVNKLHLGARIYTDFDFRSEGNQLESIRLKGLRRLRHNDVVVFNFPINNGRIAFKINYVYCKRIMGLPGDTIRITDGFYKSNNFSGELGIPRRQRQLTVYGVNPEVYEGWGVGPEQIGWNCLNAGPWYIPRCGDIVRIGCKEGYLYKDILEYETGKRVTVDDSLRRVYVGDRRIEQYEFIHDYYFAAGDNAYDSYDSRYWGLVPEEYIVGVVDLISYSKEPYSGKLRFDRMLKKI